VLNEEEEFGVSATLLRIRPRSSFELLIVRHQIVLVNRDMIYSEISARSLICALVISEYHRCAMASPVAVGRLQHTRVPNHQTEKSFPRYFPSPSAPHAKMHATAWSAARKVRWLVTNLQEQMTRCRFLSTTLPHWVLLRRWSPEYQPSRLHCAS
jgi:hypothetical protein